MEIENAAEKLTPAQEARRLERVEQRNREFTSDQARAEERRVQKLDANKASTQEYLKGIYDSAQLILRRAKADFEEYMSKAAAARNAIAIQEKQIQKALDEGYVVPAPPVPEIKVEHKVAPPAPAPVAPLDLGKIQTELNQKAQQEIAEEEARTHSDCPKCGERIQKTQLSGVHRKANKFICVPSGDPRALIRSGYAQSLEAAQAMFSDDGISPDTVANIAEVHAIQGGE